MSAAATHGDAVPLSLILIVEDDERSRKLLRDVLQFHGYHTLEAATGEEGLELARDALPHLILMDIRLPGMDGEDTLLRLRADPLTSKIPILAVTASVMRGDEQRLRRVGFDGYIAKPIDVVSLAAAVATVLANRPT